MPHERGAKDVVFLGEYETVKVLIKFDQGRGKYMIHCHNLSHEDHDMMGQFEIVDDVIAAHDPMDDPQAAARGRPVVAAMTLIGEHRADPEMDEDVGALPRGGLHPRGGGLRHARGRHPPGGGAPALEHLLADQRLLHRPRAGAARSGRGAALAASPAGADVGRRRSPGRDGALRGEPHRRPPVRPPARRRARGQPPPGPGRGRQRAPDLPGVTDGAGGRPRRRVPGRRAGAGGDARRPAAARWRNAVTSAMVGLGVLAVSPAESGSSGSHPRPGWHRLTREGPSGPPPDRITSLGGMGPPHRGLSADVPRRETMSVGKGTHP